MIFSIKRDHENSAKKLQFTFQFLLFLLFLSVHSWNSFLDQYWEFTKNLLWMKHFLTFLCSTKTWRSKVEATKIRRLRKKKKNYRLWIFKKKFRSLKCNWDVKHLQRFSGKLFEQVQWKWLKINLFEFWVIVTNKQNLQNVEDHPKTLQNQITFNISSAVSTLNC